MLTKQPIQVFHYQSFRKGSYITIEGNRKETTFHIILSGSVEIQKRNPETGEPSSQFLGKGDFFGVISAITGLPEIESAIALEEVQVISIRRDRFGDLIRKNAPLAMKIIRSYSLRLRSLDKLMDINLPGTNKVTLSDEEHEEVFQYAKNHFDFGDKNLAAYMFQTYLEYHPNGKHKLECEQNLKKLNKDLRKTKKKDAIREFFPGEIIFCEGEVGKELFVVQEGNIKIVRMSGTTEMVMNILREGSIFGEMALLDNKPRSASAVSVSKSKLAVVSKVNFHTTTELNPKLMTKVIFVLSERVWTLYRKVVNSRFEDLNLRFADMLLILAEQARAKIHPHSHFEFEIDPLQLLKIMGLPESESQKLIRFLSIHNFFKLEKGKIVCTDLSVLERFVDSNKQKALAR
ncbi:MAG: cyclic nucleotide-binding domain-containing protein [Leptospiraceae bacterium]|nr:cyclic nucleotide-binding domain-containing protein [Leptospiraceae bacterium]